MSSFYKVSPDSDIDKNGKNINLYIKFEDC